MTVNAKKTEFICMGCWGTFSPPPDAQGDVICPHCGARQDLQHEPIDLDPDEFVDLGPELAGRVAAAASDSSTGDSVAEPGGQGSGVAPEDDDFDAVIEIDLDEIDNNEESGEPSPFTEPIPSEHVEAQAEPKPAREARAAEPHPSAGPSVPRSHFHLRTERGHTYVFLSPESLVLWARSLRQSQKALQISIDGVEWQPFLAFLTRLAATGQISAEIEDELGGLQRGGDGVSDETLTESLDAERHEFEVNAPVPASGGGPAPAGDKSERRGGKSVLQKPEAPVDAGPARGVGDFTFKVDERGERPGLRYAVMLGVGVAAGAGVATALALLGLLPTAPF